MKASAPEPAAGAPCLVRELIRTFGLVERIMEPYFRQYGISGSQWGVLRNLHRAEEEGLSAVRPKELSTRLLIRPPSVTGLLGRLVTAGLVARESSAGDLRVKRVRLTDAGRRLVEQILLIHNPQLQKLVAGVSVEGQGELTRLLRTWREHLETMLE